MHIKKEQNELVSATTQLKFFAPDGKLRMADAIDQDGELYSKCIQLNIK